MKITGAIFDLDGTLFDSMFIWESVGSEYLISRSIEPEVGLDQKFKKMSIVEAAKYYQQVYGLTDSVQTIIDGVNQMIENIYASEVKLKPYVSEMLNIMNEKNIKICAATATDRYLVESTLKNHQIDEYFYSILTCTEVGAGKNLPVIYQQALELLGTDKASTLVFEDALYAMETAKNAGFTVAGVYDRSSSDESAQIIELCDEYITSYKEWSDKWL
ncbi:HAD family phosphatase [Eubacteriaceae bacterium ES3]|nr:HAD family phosphatase [Eubacteriaceae bacterium ES3]